MQGATKVEERGQSGIYLGTKPAFHFERSRVQRVIEGIVRGLYVHEFPIALPSASIVGRFRLNPPFSSEEIELVGALPLHDVGDGVFSYRFWRDPSSPTGSIWFLMFYDQTLFVVSSSNQKSNQIVETETPSGIGAA
jgi:hypothetical protein